MLTVCKWGEACTAVIRLQSLRWFEQPFLVTATDKLISLKWREWCTGRGMACERRNRRMDARHEGERYFSRGGQ